MKNTTISVRIDKNALDVLNFVIQTGAYGYCQYLNSVSPSDIFKIRHADMNLAAFWHKISVQLVTLKVKNSSKKVSMSFDINHWKVFTELATWYKSPDPYLGVIFRDIDEQIRQKMAMQPSIFVRHE